MTYSSTVWPKYATTSATTRDAVASSSPVLIATWRTRSCGYCGSRVLCVLRRYESSIDVAIVPGVNPSGKFLPDLGQKKRGAGRRVCGRGEQATTGPHTK